MVERPAPGTTGTVAKTKSFKSRMLGWLVKLVILSVVLFAVYLWGVLNWSYSVGDRAGYLQKFSEKGWICKTWEGDLAMVTMPGTATETFHFTVRDDKVAAQIREVMSKRVSLQYEEHIGVPNSCFGETSYWVTGVRVVNDVLAPATAPQATPTDTPATKP